MTISINQITSGSALNIDGNIYFVTDYNHVKPGKGSAFVKVRLRNVKTQQVLERTFRSSERLEDVPLEERRFQMMYQAGDDFHFMDLTSYEEVVVAKDVMGEAVRFLQEHLEVTGTCFHHEVLTINLPTFIVTRVTHSDPGLKGDSSRAGTKPAVIDTGTTIQVPLFINTGDWVKVDTRTGTYVERVKK